MEEFRYFRSVKNLLFIVFIAVVVAGRGEQIDRSKLPGTWIFSPEDNVIHLYIVGK